MGYSFFIPELNLGSKEIAGINSLSVFVSYTQIINFSKFKGYSGSIKEYNAHNILFFSFCFTFIFLLEYIRSLYCLMHHFYQNRTSQYKWW